jgi:hypothetical protein
VRLPNLDRLAARFNRWFGATAVAAGAEHQGAAGGPPVVDPLAVAAIQGEVARDADETPEQDQ